MPGSNDFSMAPDIMEPAYDIPSSSTPTLTRRSTPIVPKMTPMIGGATVQNPVGIATKPTTVGNLGDPYTNLPKIYTRGNFEQSALEQKYGKEASWWDKQKFKRYLKSDQGIADKNQYIASENAKELSSYQDYARALSEQSKARMLAAKRDFDVAVAKFDQPVEETPPQPQVPPTKPALTPRSNAEWNRIASENGFKDMDEVRAWQEANGLAADGKFGNNSSAYFKTNGLGKYQRTPVEENNPRIPSGYVELSRQDGSTFLQRYNPVSSTPASSTPVSTTPTEPSTGFDIDAFRKSQGLKSDAYVTHNGSRYLRYDPSGAGDFYIGEDGNMYRADWGGKVGNAIDHSTATRNNAAWGRHYNEVYSKLAGFKSAAINKQGGTMNRINYFQQGGAAPQQDIKAQVTALVQAAMQGDQKATQQVNQIMEAAKAGDQQAMQIATLMEQVIKELQGQAVAAKYGTKLSYLQSLKCGGKTKKKEKGGKVCSDCEKANNKQVISKHQSGGAVGFYRNWSKDEVRKLQNRLAAYGYYDGELDGIVGSQTIAAVKKFQTEHGVKADGMWGHNTNSQKQFVDASTASKGSYKPTHKTEQGSLHTYEVSGKKMKEQDYYKAINQLKEQFYADPEAFWNAGGDTAKWREHLYTTPEGTAIMEEFYSATPDDVRKRLGSRVTNRRMQQDQMDSGIREANGRAARVAVTKVLPVMGGIAAAPAMLLNPVTAGLGIGGGLAGRGIAGNVAENLTAGDTSTWTATDGMGNVASVATPTSDLAVPVAEVVGGAAGAAAGVLGSQYVGAPSTQGLAGYQRTNNSAPARTYRSQRRIGGGRFGKHGHLGDGKALDRQVRLNDGTFGFKYQPATPRYQAYLEGAGGNPSYTVVPIGMKNGGNFPRRKYFSLI